MRTHLFYLTIIYLLMVVLFVYIVRYQSREKILDERDKLMAKQQSYIESQQKEEK